MISVTFAIIGFLIANLAIKESFTYNLLFKKSYFFPVVFIALTVIVCFLILSTLGDWLPLEYQRDALLVGTYLIIGVVFLIGFLFTRLVRFTNQKHILNLTKRALLSEYKRNLILSGERIISSNEVAKLGLPLHSMAFLRQTTKGDFALPEGKNTISDIKINSLRKRVAALKDKDLIFVKNVFIGREIIGNEDGFFFVEQSNYSSLKKDIINLNKTIITTRSANTPSEAKDYVVQKLMESIGKNEDKLLESYLDMFIDVYSLQQTFKV
jgi:hypothetical protein